MKKSKKNSIQGQCEPISCPSIPPLENGQVDCSGVGTTSKCEFICNPGYLLSGVDNNGSHEVSCLATEQWNGQIDNLTCEPLYCPTFTVDDTV